MSAIKAKRENIKSDRRKSQLVERFSHGRLQCETGQSKQRIEQVMKMIKLIDDSLFLKIAIEVNKKQDRFRQQEQWLEDFEPIEDLICLQHLKLEQTALGKGQSLWKVFRKISLKTRHTPRLIYSRVFDYLCHLSKPKIQQIVESSQKIYYKMRSPSMELFKPSKMEGSTSKVSAKTKNTDFKQQKSRDHSQKSRDQDSNHSSIVPSSSMVPMDIQNSRSRVPSSSMVPMDIQNSRRNGSQVKDANQSKSENRPPFNNYTTNNNSRRVPPIVSSVLKPSASLETIDESKEEEKKESEKKEDRATQQEAPPKIQPAQITQTQLQGLTLYTFVGTVSSTLNSYKTNKKLFTVDLEGGRSIDVGIWDDKWSQIQLEVGKMYGFRGFRKRGYYRCGIREEQFEYQTRYSSQAWLMEQRVENFNLGSSTRARGLNEAEVTSLTFEGKVVGFCPSSSQEQTLIVDIGQRLIYVDIVEPLMQGLEFKVGYRYRFTDKKQRNNLSSVEKGIVMKRPKIELIGH